MWYLCYICVVLENLAFQASNKDLQAGLGELSRILVGQGLSPNPKPGEKAQRNGPAHLPCLRIPGYLLQNPELWEVRWGQSGIVADSFALSSLFSPCENPEGVTGQIEACVQLSSRNWEFRDEILHFPGWNFVFPPVQLLRGLEGTFPTAEQQQNLTAGSPKPAEGLGGSWWASHGVCRTLEQVLEALESLGYPKKKLQIKSFSFCLGPCAALVND